MSGKQGSATWVLLPAPFGSVSLRFDDGVVRLVHLSSARAAKPWPELAQDIALHYPLAQSVADYLAGGTMALPRIAPLANSDFARRVYRALQCTELGATVSYGQLAERAGSPGAARAVGRAMAANPLPLLVPCHRVLAQDGSLGGFTPGLAIKRWLLDHETALLHRSAALPAPRCRSPQ